MAPSAQREAGDGISAGGMPSPSPSGRCISTVSTQRPNLKPTERSVPTRRNPWLLCRAMEGALPLSPMTAIICRQRLASRDEGGKQMAADAAAAQRLADIDGVLDRIAIGGAGAIGCCIAVADDGTARLCDEIGQAAAERVLAPARELLDRGRLLLEGGQPVPDMMRIDALDCWQIGGKRIADYGVTHEFGLLLRLAWSCGGSPRGWIGSRAAANRLYFRRRREGEPRCRASISFPRPISPRSRTPCRVSRARSRPASTLRARNAPSSARTRPSPSWRTTPSSSSRCKSW